MSRKSNKKKSNNNQKKVVKKETKDEIKKVYEIKKIDGKDVPKTIEFQEFDNLKDSKIKENDNKIKDTKEEKNKEKEIIKESVKEEIKEEEKDIKEEKKNKETNLNDQIQSFISILFTVIIFLALILLIIVLYNNYLKKEEIDYDKVCADYIEKDYGITRDMIENFVKNGRAIIYNYDNFEKSKLTNEDLIKFASYFIWSSDLEYQKCEEDDERCLVSKMSMSFDELKKQFKNYLDINDLKINYQTEYNDEDKLRLYQDGDIVTLTFSEFEYQSLRHNIVATNVKEDKVIVTFALEELIPDTNIYKYVGYKTVELKYHDKNFAIESIKTSLK